MIQRKQTLFLFQLVFLGIALLFIPSVNVFTESIKYGVFLVPVNNSEIQSTYSHIAAIALNFIGLVLACLTVFLYKKRELQRRLCHVLAILWSIITLMILFCPFIESSTVKTLERNYLAVFIGIVGIAAAYMAARYIKKDIELLKSADRIR